MSVSGDCDIVTVLLYSSMPIPGRSIRKVVLEGKVICSVSSVGLHNAAIRRDKPAKILEEAHNQS